MPSKTRAKKTLADPTTIAPYQKKPEESTTGTAPITEDLLQVIIETPKGCRNKYSFDVDQEIFVLKSALPTGMVFPYDFGFIPRTLGGDGDPLDVLVLMDEPAFSGCALLTRLIGVLEGEQTAKGKTTRNDRLIAVAEAAHEYANLRHLKDAPKQMLKEVEQFFVNYHRLQGKTFKVLGRKGPKTAHRLIDQGRKLASQKGFGRSR